MIRYIILCVCFIGNGMGLYAQLSVADSLFVADCNTKAQNLWRTDFDSSYYYFDLAEKRIADQQLIPDFIFLRYNKTQLCFDHINTQQLYKELKRNDEILIGRTAQFDSVYQNISIYLHQFWGDYHQYIGNYNAAAKVYTEVLSTLEEDHQTLGAFDSILIAKIHTTLGDTYKILGKYEKAVSHLNQRLGLVDYVENIYPGEGREGFTYLSIGNILLEKNELEEAYSTLQKSLALNISDYNKHDNYRGRVISNYYSISEYFIKKNQYEKSIESLEKSIPFHENDDHFFGQTYTKLGISHALLGNIEKSQHFLNKALPFTIKKYGNKSDYTARIYNRIAQNYFIENDIKKGNEYFQKAIHCISIENENPKLDIRESFSQMDFLKILLDRAESYHTLFDSSQNTEDIKQCYQAAKKALEAYQNFRTTSLGFEDKRILAQQVNNIFDILIPTGYHLSTQDATYDKKELFHFMELSQSQVLLEKMTHSQSKANSLIPISTLEQQRNLIFELESIQIQYSKQEDKTLQEAILLKEKLNEVQKSLETFNIKLKSDFPEYATHSSEHPIISLEDAQALLHKDQCFLHYFNSGPTLYIIYISQVDFDIFSVQHKTNINKEIQTLKDGILGYHLSSKQSEKLYEEKNNQYIQSAYDLYQLLIQPVEDKTQEEIIIIPHGVLSYIPFEALISNIPKKNSTFKNHDYLIRKKTISYAFSVTSLSKMKQQKNTNHNTIIFAPQFDDITTKNESIASLRAGLGQLKYNQKEAAAIHQLAKGKLLKGKDAQLKTFIQEAGNYSIIHIASHGKALENNPSQSYIAFGNAADEKIYLSQLEALTLNTEMVTLSACEMGIGQLSKGEGLQSMAVGFVAAGSKSVVASLWSVNDASTATIMTAFYESLKQGLSKNKAMHQAKMDYMEQADHFRAHPFYWSGFVVMGDETSISFNGWNQWIWWGIGAIGLALFGFIYLKRRTTPKA